MKHCNKCDTTKATTEFYKNASKKDGLQSICKPCTNETSKSHYVRNVDQYLAKKVRLADENRRRIQEAKSVPCTDCKIQYPYYVMDFDHLGDKVYNVHDMDLTSTKKILDEMAKCEVVCSNCHRIRTYERYNLAP